LDGCAALLGLLSLIRVPTVAAMVNFRSVLATGAMMVVPALIKPDAGATGLFVSAGIGT
jgi:hypothetical protein